MATYADMLDKLAEIRARLQRGQDDVLDHHTLNGITLDEVVPGTGDDDTDAG